MNCIPWFEPNERFLKVLHDLENQFNLKISVVESDYLQKIEGLYANVVPNDMLGFLKYTEDVEHKSAIEVLNYLLEKENIIKTVDNLLELLNESVRRRVQILPNFCKNCTNKTSESSCSHAKVGLLFSGGLDSAILAVIANDFVATNEEIDLINVAFEKKNNSNYQVPDRITGRETFNELLEICPNRKFNFIEVHNFFLVNNIIHFLL